MEKVIISPPSITLSFWLFCLFPYLLALLMTLCIHCILLFVLNGIHNRAKDSTVRRRFFGHVAQVISVVFAWALGGGPTMNRKILLEVLAARVSAELLITAPIAK
jgi:hypothetical protein